MHKNNFNKPSLLFFWKKTLFPFVCLLLLLGVFLTLYNQEVQAEETAEMVKEWTGKLNVPADKVWTIAFNRQLSKEQDLHSFIDVKTEQGDDVQVSVTLGEGQKEIKVSPPAGGYDTGAVYILMVDKGIKDEHGKSMSLSVEMPFIIERPQSEKVELAPHTKTIDANQTTISGAYNQDVFIVSNKEGESFQAGEIIILPPTEEYPYGLAKKIESTRTVENGIEINTSEPYFDELFTELDINKTIQITEDHLVAGSLPENVTVTSYQVNQMDIFEQLFILSKDPGNYALHNVIELKFNNSLLEIPGPKGVEFNVNTNGTVRLSMPKANFNIRTIPSKISANLHTVLSYQLTLNVEGSYEKEDLKEVDLNKIKKYLLEKGISLGKYMVPIAAPVFAEVNVGLKANAEIKGSGNLTLEGKSELDAGVALVNGKIRDFSVDPNQTLGLSTYLTGEVNGQFGPYMGLGITLASITGTEVQLYAGGYASLGGIVGTSDSEKLFTCLKGDYGLFFDADWIFKIRFIDDTKLSLVKVKKKIDSFNEGCTRIKSIVPDKNFITLSASESEKLLIKAEYYHVLDSVSLFKKIEDIPQGSFTESLTYKSRNESIVTVSDNGIVMAKEIDKTQETMIDVVYKNTKYPDKGPDQKPVYEWKTSIPVRIIGKMDVTGSVENIKNIKDSYKFINSSTSSKSIQLGKDYDYVVYNHKDEVISFGKGSGRLSIGADSYAIVSYRENITGKFELPEGVTKYKVVEFALTEAMHKGTAHSEWHSQSDKTEEIKISEGTYSFAVYNEEGKLTNYGKRDISFTSSIYIPANGKVIVTSYESTPLFVYGPATVFSFQKAAHPAVAEGELAPGESVEWLNMSGHQENVTVTKGSYSYATYKVEGKGLNNYGKRVNNYDSTLYIPSGGAAIITNTGEEAITVYAAMNEFSFEESSHPALVEETLAPGEATEWLNVSEQQQSITLTKGAFSVKKYDIDGELTSEKESNNSYDTTIYVAKGGKAVIRNNGSGVIHIYAPLTEFTK